MGLITATEKTALRIAASLDANGGGQTSGTDADRLFPATEKTLLRIADRVGEISGGGALADSLAIIIDGDKTSYASGAAIGDFVYVKNSTITGVTDGMYTAAKTIPYNTAVDSTYLTACDGGGLNELKDILQFSGYITTVNPGQHNYIRLTFQKGNSATVAIISAYAFCSVYSHENGSWVQTSTSSTYKATKVSTYVTDVYVSEWVPVIIIATNNTVQVSIR